MRRVKGLLQSLQGPREKKKKEKGNPSLSSFLSAPFLQAKVKGGKKRNPSPLKEKRSTFLAFVTSTRAAEEKIKERRRGEGDMPFPNRGVDRQGKRICQRPLSMLEHLKLAFKEKNAGKKKEKREKHMFYEIVLKLGKGGEESKRPATSRC